MVEVVIIEFCIKTGINSGKTSYIVAVTALMASFAKKVHVLESTTDISTQVVWTAIFAPYHTSQPNSGSRKQRGLNTQSILCFRIHCKLIM